MSDGERVAVRLDYPEAELNIRKMQFFYADSTAMATISTRGSLARLSANKEVGHSLSQL